MARVQTSVAISEVTGSLGGGTFYNSSGGQALKRRSGLSRRSTGPALAARAVFQQVNSAWSGLDLSTRAQWVSAMGDATAAKARFQQVITHQVLTGGILALTPPMPVSLGVIEMRFFSLDVTDSAFLIESSAPGLTLVDAALVAVKMTLRPGGASCDGWFRNVAALAPGMGFPVDLTAAVRRVCGSLIRGAGVVLRVISVSRSTGADSLPAYLKAIVA